MRRGAQGNSGLFMLDMTINLFTLPTAMGRPEQVNNNTLKRKKKDYENYLRMVQKENQRERTY